ncbi:MAG: EF-P lysine aminoacylase GenX [Hahellaceae bacterium]|nr:EF-P lysine aminoacylase GenX [Hahellaceae bacterium]MCP5169988.1 EF-P lysine aminoacylase GenX [Hahellaceae bacterium]
MTSQTLFWQPACNMAHLRKRAEVLGLLRAFFAQREVMEVDTPLLCHASVTDVHLASVTTHLTYPGDEGKVSYLQTSPEFSMKRLLAAGSGPIFQICKAFRGGERGRRHNPEFTMLEWYRPTFSLAQLMDEVEALLASLGVIGTARRTSYRQAFITHAGVDPYAASDDELKQLAEESSGIAGSLLDRDGALDVILTHRVEPLLGVDGPEFITGYPASQAALAKVCEIDGYLQAQRFELYIDGLELANGYDELVDADEQLRRFEQDNRQREAMGLPTIAVDHRLVAALKQGLPPCSGVALGVDRLLMVLLDTRNIDDVLAFPVDCT